MLTGIYNPRQAVFGGICGYLSELRNLALGPCERTDWEQRCFAALNGEASKELRRVAPIDVRRKFGAFFTGSDLSERLLAKCNGFSVDSVLYDPTCGMGDLLLAAARRLPLGKTLRHTLRNWGVQITGTELHQEFVEGAKIRLVILARQRHKADEITNNDCNDCFPNIRVADGLSEQAAYERATNILLNPPFGAVAAPEGCNWAGGRVTAATMFVITALERAKPGTVFQAILPDVLRSGSFSNRWRHRISELADIELVEPYGIFDDSADVDVFLLHLVRRQTNGKLGVKKWPQPIPQQRIKTVADYFKVYIGRVVPHRDRKTGPCYTYIHPRCVSTWTVMRRFTETRKHMGRAFQPPFVVIRRTSRPGDLYRATATVISGKRGIAVENHLVVCIPKDGKLTTCKSLMQQLKTKDVNEYLNVRIRCRHLTIDAVGTIPFKLNRLSPNAD